MYCIGCRGYSVLLSPPLSSCRRNPDVCQFPLCQSKTYPPFQNILDIPLILHYNTLVEIQRPHSPWPGSALSPLPGGEAFPSSYYERYFIFSLSEAHRPSWPVGSGRNVIPWINETQKRLSGPVTPTPGFATRPHGICGYRSYRKAGGAFVTDLSWRCGCHVQTQSVDKYRILWYTEIHHKSTYHKNM